MYLIAAVVDDLRELENVSLVANQLLLLLLARQLDLVLFQELLKKSNSERRLFLADDVVLGGDIESGQGAVGVELLIVERKEGLIDLLTATMGRALCRDGCHFLLALFFHLHPAVAENGVQFLLPYCELLLDLPVGAHRLLNPGVSSNFLDFQSFRGLEGDQPLEEILERVGEETDGTFAGVGLPKDIVFLFLEDLVVGVGGGGLLEGRVAGVHDEENDSGSKNVNNFTLIFLVGNLRGHVSLSAQLGPEHSSAVLALEQAGEAEIGDLEDEEVGEQQVLGLDIAVRVALLVHVVQPVHHLVEVGPRHLLREFTSLGHKIKQLSTPHELQHDGEAGGGGLVFGLVGGALSDAEQSDQVLVVELLHDPQFVLERLEGGGFFFVFFDGDLRAVLVDSQLDPASLKRYSAW